MLNQEIINFANHLADLAAPITKKYFRVSNGENTKSDDTPVTKADHEIEAKLREAIMQKFPTHGIIGEEFSNHNENAEFKWIIDPIDGTASFVIGRPLFGTLIALTYQGKSILGIMDQAITGERFVGIKDQGSFLNGKKIKTRNCHELNNAMLCTTSPFFFKNNDAEILKKLSSTTKYQNCGGITYGGDCYLYAMLACGFVDVVIDTGLKVFDFAALIPIIEMAGGVVSDWQGNELELKSNAKMLACGSKEIQQKILEIINAR